MKYDSGSRTVEQAFLDAAEKKASNLFRTTKNFLLFFQIITSDDTDYLIINYFALN